MRSGRRACSPSSRKAWQSRPTIDGCCREVNNFLRYGVSAHVRAVYANFIGSWGRSASIRSAM